MAITMSSFFVGLAAFSVILSVVALIVACVSTSQNTTDANALTQHMFRSHSHEQTLFASVATPILFNMEKVKSRPGDIVYLDTGVNAGSLQVSRSGVYKITMNAAVNVSGQGLSRASVPAPVSTWIHKSGDPTFYGLQCHSPIEAQMSTSNCHYIHTESIIPLAPGDTFYVCALSSEEQSLLGGSTRYLAVTKVASL